MLWVSKYKILHLWSINSTTGYLLMFFKFNVHPQKLDSLLRKKEVSDWHSCNSDTR